MNFQRYPEEKPIPEGGTSSKIPLVPPSKIHFSVAILVDWENVRLNLFHNAPRLPRSDYRNPENLLNFFLSFLEDNEFLYRIFMYVSELPEKARFKQDFLSTDTSPRYAKLYKAHQDFLRKISVCEYIAVRKGKLKFRGYNKEGEPILVQKQVDMLMGLDIAHLAYERLVDRVMIFSADTDMVPALKIARTKGLQVILPICEDVDDLKVPIQLKEHADIIRKRKFNEICG